MLVLITESPLAGSPSSKNQSPGHPLQWLGMGLEGQRKEREEPTVQGSVGGQQLPALPHCHTAYPLLVLCICRVQSQTRSLWPTQIPSKHSNCKWKVEGETFAPYPKSHIQSAQAAGIFQVPKWAPAAGNTGATSGAELPLEQPQSIPPDPSPGPQTLGLLSPRIHPAPETQMRIQSWASSPGQDTPGDMLPFWGLISTENTTVGPRFIFKNEEKEGIKCLSQKL